MTTVATALTQADSTLVFTSGTFDQMLEAAMTQERLIAPLLFQVEARDPMTFSGTAVVLVVVGVLAVWVLQGAQRDSTRPAHPVARPRTV